MRGLRIAMIGQRGVPATFGGVEHHVEELGAGLSSRGHRVTVFCRTNYAPGAPRFHRGMRVVSLPTVPTKHLDAIVHSALSTTAAMADSFDIIHYHAVGPGIPAFLPRAFSRAKVVQTIHGLDSERAKWSMLARSVLSAGEWLSARVPDATIVVSRSLAHHFAGKYGKRTSYVPNGVTERTRRPAERITERFGLQAGNYVLFVGRMVPEKAPHLLIRAFKRIPTDMRLVLVGGSSFTDGYVRELREDASADSRTIFTGYAYGPLLDELYTNAALFVLPSSLEGLPLTLLEAAAYGTPVLVSDIPPHLEVVPRPGPGTRIFPTGDEGALVAALRESLRDVPLEREGAASFRSEILRSYRWEDVVSRTESVYRAILPRSATRPGRPVPVRPPAVS